MNIKAIRYRPNLSCIIKREVVLPWIITFPIFNCFCIYSSTCLSRVSWVITKYKSPLEALINEPSPSAKPTNQVKKSGVGCSVLPYNLEFNW